MPNPPALLTSEKLDGFFQDVRKRFDLIMFDAPPVLAVTDSGILAPKVDGTIFVYRVRKTSKTALARAKVQIENAKSGALKGIILNNVKPESRIDYPYYYYPYRAQDEQRSSDATMAT